MRSGRAARPKMLCAPLAHAPDAHPHPVAIIRRMPLKPEVTVAALAEHDGRFLIVEELIEGRSVFNQPAGHVEVDETLVEAVTREAREESAWRFTPQHLVGIYLLGGAGSQGTAADTVGPRRRGRATGRRPTLRFAFAGTVDDHRPGQPLDRGILRTHWLTRGELAERQPRLRSPLVLRCIDDYLAGRRHPLDLVAYLDLESAVNVKAVSV